MADSKFLVTPETKQLEFEAALLAHEDEICAEYERKQAEAAANGGGDDKKDRGKSSKDDNDLYSRDGDRRGRSRSGERGRRSRSRSRDDRSRSRSRSRGRSGRDRDRDRKSSRRESPMKPPKRGFQEILDKRAVNLGIIFDALVEKAVVKRKEEVRCLGPVGHTICS